MPIVSGVAERTAAATDLMVALFACGGVAAVKRLGGRAPWKAAVWSGVFGLLALSSALGVISHGLRLPPAIDHLLWHPLYLGLGLTVALFAVAVIHDLWGLAASRKAMPYFIGVGVAFYAVRLVASGSFFYFIVYEGVVMILALAAYLVLALRRRLDGAWLMAAGVLLSVLAAAAQADEKLSFRLIWEFDHNGVFHLIQLAGIVFLIAGLCTAFATGGPRWPGPGAAPRRGSG